MNQATLSQEIETRARALAEDLAAIVRRDALAAVSHRLGVSPRPSPGLVNGHGYADRILSVLHETPRVLFKSGELARKL